MKKSVRILMKFTPLWWLTKLSLGWVSLIYTKLKNARMFDESVEHRRQSVDKKCNEIFKDKVVLNGPFKGMVYPDMLSAGSALFPKLLGSYENELSGVINNIINKSYSSIVDIGCAEGYYAVGLGMRCKPESVFIFDVNRDALDMCQEMAALNGVEVVECGFCNASTLTDLKLGGKALIFSDCEGYEKELFQQEVILKLVKHDFLIETHDLADMTISGALIDRFSKTHDVTVIESIDDIIKAYDYQYDELVGMTLEERFLVVAEYRSKIMRWIYCKPKI